MKYLVQTIDDLPNVAPEDLILDIETTSGDPTKTSLNPWWNCDVLGVAIYFDKRAWYVPVGHHHGNNLDRFIVRNWIKTIVDNSDSWINHNVKYDAHVLKNCFDIDPPQRLVDTVTLAKLIDSDLAYKGGYGLDNLAKLWLDHDITHFEKAFAPYLNNNKDYGAIPIDIMAPYACQDVLTPEELYTYIQKKLYCPELAEIEIQLTRILYEIEQRGLYVIPRELDIQQLFTLAKMLRIEEKLANIVGYPFRPHTNADCFDVLCNHYGLPVLGWTDKGEPSFDKHAMAQYQVHPEAPSEVVDLILQYRNLNTLNNLFITKYQNINVDGLIHSQYNQTVRTGRMSCRDPNAQQLSVAAKKLIHPKPGFSFISIDFSQIEFRIIAHYIDQPEIIEAYRQDPTTDFHNWVAEMVGIPRKPAKNFNFMMGYGGGKKKTRAMLATDKTIVGTSKGGSIEDYRRMCQQRAEEVYESYHEKMYNLKRTSDRAARASRTRGYVFNLMGRRRYLPRDKGHLAFNSLCQSTAADIMKERLVALAKHLDKTNWEIVANVHDEVLIQAPHEEITRTRVKEICQLIQSPKVDMRVPLLVDCKVGNKSWAEVENYSLQEKVA